MAKPKVDIKIQAKILTERNAERGKAQRIGPAQAQQRPRKRQAAMTNTSPTGKM